METILGGNRPYTDDELAGFVLMALYRRKPTTIEAVQFHMPVERPTRPGPDATVKGVHWYDWGSKQQHPSCITMHGRVEVRDGDWILPEPDGVHYYPVAEGIFEATYEKVV